MPGADPRKGKFLLASVAYAAGRGTGKIRPVGGGVSRVGAVVGGVAAAALWATMYGLINLRRYRKGGISKKDAVRRTTAESVGMGLATGVGIAATNAARASAFIATSAVLVPFLVGTAVTGVAKAAWEQKVSRQLLESKEDGVTETGDYDSESRENNCAIAPANTGRST